MSLATVPKTKLHFKTCPKNSRWRIIGVFKQSNAGILEFYCVFEV